MKAPYIDTKQKDFREIRVITGNRGIPVRVRRRGRWLQVINIQRHSQESVPSLGKARYSLFEVAMEDGSICTVAKSHEGRHWVEAIPRCRTFLSKPSARIHVIPTGYPPLEGQMIFVGSS